MSAVTEAEVLQTLLPELEQVGYDVYLHPHRTLLPPFLKDYVPDAIAIRDDNHIAIEIALRKSSHRQDRIAQIAKLFEGQKNWQFRVYWDSAAGQQTPLAIQPKKAIQKQISEIKELDSKLYRRASFLLAWATYEAIARAIMHDSFARPTSPERLTEVLAREGCITPSEADRLRVLSDKRNGLIHGGLQIEISDREMNAFIDILEMLLEQLHA